MDFIRQLVRPSMWVTRDEEILDRDARGETPVEIASAVRVSVARVRRVLYNQTLVEVIE
jgi:hypothetical protein